MQLKPESSSLPGHRELRALAKQLNADVSRLNRELRTVLETSNRARDALFRVAKERRSDEKRALQEATCAARTRNDLPCRRKPLELGGYCATHHLLSDHNPRAGTRE